MSYLCGAVVKSIAPQFMAKGNAMGIWRGKKGSTVFYYNRNSNNGQKQAMRERVYEISNPKSSAQANQRMKMAPAQRVANALNAIIKRSWQGIDYGGKGRQEFMKYALRMTSGYPYVEEGDNRAVPGEYQISTGSIGTVTMTEADVDMFDSNIKLTVMPAEVTIGGLSENLLQQNSWLREGDQITLIACNTNARGSDEVLTSDYYWAYSSFIIDPNSAEDISTISLGDAEIAQDISNNSLAIATSNNLLLAATAIIISRLNGSTYERSNSKIFVGSNLGAWFTPTQRGRARRSYEKQDAAASTNWPVEPEDGEGGGSGGTAVDTTYTISGLTGDKAGANGKVVRVQANDVTGNLVAVYVANATDEPIGGTRPVIVGINNQPITYDVGMQVNGLNPSEVTALASLRQIVVD